MKYLFEDIWDDIEHVWFFPEPDWWWKNELDDRQMDFAYLQFDEDVHACYCHKGGYKTLKTFDMSAGGPSTHQFSSLRLER